MYIVYYMCRNKESGSYFLSCVIIDLFHSNAGAGIWLLLAFELSVQKIKPTCAIISYWSVSIVSYMTFI